MNFWTLTLVTVDDCLHLVEVARHEVLQGLGVERLADHRGAGDVREQDGENLAARGHGGGGRFLTHHLSILTSRGRGGNPALAGLDTPWESGR